MGPAEQHRIVEQGLQHILITWPFFLADRKETGFFMAAFHSEMRFSEQAFFPHDVTFVAKVSTTSTLYVKTTLPYFGRL